jgi:DNA-directed RNA polymerase specialized sigma24 family protein
VDIHADQFAAERPRLVAVATKIVGSQADAGDVLQEPSCG